MDKEKTWHNENPPKPGDYICRLHNAYIKMCHWNGEDWREMWAPFLIVPTVKEWMYIPYD